ncbi:AEC family transporter [Clostridium sp. SYSU_GA19001]|uniref:AEC family transporter n=1 Tax=Clostridium caldaquaticum TaxID=2940653 RepID=UPI002076E7B1|nr:AEC family transporter [Clostridium caldaquaticum]MCM8710253.1 AEC family transporter [Clostridium caldaquaticum]
MNSVTVIEQVISLFLIILVGVYASKREIITDKVNKALSEMLLRVTLPLLIVSSFNLNYSKEIADNILKCFLYSFIVFIITPILSYIFLLPVKSRRKNILQFANVFSNCGFMGFAVMNSIYGAEGVAYAAIFNMFFNVLVWTYGVALFSDRLSLKGIKKVLLNPCLIAVYIGISIMIFNIKLHPIITSSLKSVGSMTTPLSMIMIGVILSKADLKIIFKDWTIYYGSFIKLIIIPSFFYAAALLMKDSSNVMNTMIILQAMPAAATTSIFAESFDKEKEFSAGIVFLTTLLCTITFPLILKFVL